MRRAHFGGLDVVLAGGTDRDGGGTGPLVVLLHGFGAPGDDLVSLHRVLEVPPGTRFAFPAAPVELSAFGYGDARAWWMIDMMKLQAAMARGDVRDLTKDVPPGLFSARLLIDAMLDELTEILSPSHLVLGGFSQGAMLSADVALRSTRPLAGLVLLSGTMIAEAEWKPLMAKRAGLPVFQSHGQSDAMLPFSIAERLSKELSDAGMKTRFVPFRGGHEIPPPALDGLNGFLGDVLA